MEGGAGKPLSQAGGCHCSVCMGCIILNWSCAILGGMETTAGGGREGGREEGGRKGQKEGGKKTEKRGGEGGGREQRMGRRKYMQRREREA